MKLKGNPVADLKVSRLTAEGTADGAVAVGELDAAGFAVE